MKKFQRVLALLLAVVMTVSMFAACGNKIEDEQANVTPATDVTPEATQPTESEPIVTEPTPAVTDPTTAEPPVTEPTQESTTEPTEPTEAPATNTTKSDDGSFTVEDMSATMYATDSVNVRSGPSADYDRVGSFKKNEAVTVTGRASTGWYRVEIKGGVGYVSNSYLTDKKPSEVVTVATTDDDDTGDVNIDDDNTSTTPPANISYGNWAEDNGWEYIMKHVKDTGYANAINAIAEGMQNLETSIFIDSSFIPKDEVEDFAQLISPLIAVEFCYVKRIVGFNKGQYDQGILRVDVEYYVDSKSEADKMVSELRTKANSVIKSIKSSSSDYNKIQALHDWLVRNVTPDADNYQDRDDLWVASAYGAIVDGRATCLGYAKAMFYLLSKAGYDATFVVGKGHAAKHIWVKVRMDGKWYNIDPTWDDPVSQTAGDPDLVYYDYFMVSDAYMSMSHVAVYDMMFYSVPAASSDSKCWHKVNGYYIDDEDDIEKILAKATKDAVNGGGKYEYVRLKFANTSLYDTLSNKYKKSTFNTYLADYTSKYTCTNKWLGTASAAPETHSCTLTFKLSK